MYAVVSFVDDVENDDDSEAIEITSEVPSCWLSDDLKQCYWPTSKNLSSLILRQIKPNTNSHNWKLHDIRFESYYERLEDARRRAVIISSGDESSVPYGEGRGCRQKKYGKLNGEKKSAEAETSIHAPKKKVPSPPNYNFDSEVLLHIADIPIVDGNKVKDMSFADAVITECNQVPNTLPATKSDASLVMPCCSKSKKVYPKLISSHLLAEPLMKINSVSHGQSSSSTLEGVPVPVQSPSTDASSSPGDDYNDETLPKMDYVSSRGRTDRTLMNRGNSFTTPTSSHISHITHKKFEKVEPSAPTLRLLIETELDKLYRKPAEMTVELRQVNESLIRLQNRPSEATINTNPVFAMIEKSIPFKTREEVTKFEADIAADIIPKSTLIHWMKKIGGNSMKDSTTRILKRVFTNGLGKESTWLGQRNNFKVCDLTIMNCIKDATFAKYNFTEKEFEVVASEWFRQAKQRYDRDIAKAVKAARSAQ